MRKYLLLLEKDVRGGTPEWPTTTTIVNSVIYKDIEDVLAHISSFIVRAADSEVCYIRDYDGIMVKALELEFTDRGISNNVIKEVSLVDKLGIRLDEVSKFLHKVKCLGE